MAVSAFVPLQAQLFPVAEKLHFIINSAIKYPQILFTIIEV